MLYFMSVAVVVILSFLVLAFIATRIYRKTPKGEALVITTFKGKKEKVILNGGTFFFGLWQTMTKVNLKAIKLSITKDGEKSLNTKDRMLVDVTVDFDMQCKTDEASIALAAEKLGTMTMSPKDLQTHMESKFEGAMRAVSQGMTHDELFEDRPAFNKAVMQNITESLVKVGFELQDVNLVDIKQTPLSEYKDNNVFNAEGKALVTKRISEKLRETNAIEQETKVDIQRKNMEAEKQSLELAREQEYARLEQERELAEKRASQGTKIANQEAEQFKLKEATRISAQQETSQSEIASKQAIDESRIASERKVEEDQIAMNLAIETQRINKDKEVQSKEIERQKVLELANQDKLVALTDATKLTEESDVRRRQGVELAEYERQVAVAKASQEKSISEAAADEARALATKERENVITVEKMAIAEREKNIRLTKAAEEAEENAIETKVSAAAEKDAAIDRAEALKISSEAEAQKVTVTAEADKKAELAKVEVLAKRYQADADGKQKLHDAENALSDQQIKLKKELKLIDQLPEIMKQLNKPIEKIDSIKIFQTDGIMGGGKAAPVYVTNEKGDKVLQPVAQPTSPIDQLRDSLIQYQFQKPLVESFLKDFGMQNPSDPVAMVAGLINDEPTVAAKAPKRPNGPMVN